MLFGFRISLTSNNILALVPSSKIYSHMFMPNIPTASGPHFVVLWSNIYIFDCVWMQKYYMRSYRDIFAITSVPPMCGVGHHVLVLVVAVTLCIMHGTHIDERKFMLHTTDTWPWSTSNINLLLHLTVFAKMRTNV